ncbi:26088_t:CDS:2, partial [Racocetra persica]
ELSQMAKKLARDSVSPFYKARSDRYWGLYKEFCKRFDLDVENPREEVVVNSLHFEGKEDFRKNLAVTQVLRAIKKETSKNKTPDWSCDLLPIEALSPGIKNNAETRRNRRPKTEGYKMGRQRDFVGPDLQVENGPI